MPYVVPQPTPDAFASYLEELLGGFGPNFNVHVQPAQLDQNGREIPGTGFFHITKKSSQGLLKTNLKLELGHQSDFKSTYGGRTTEQNERAPELFATGDKRWVFGGSMPAQASVSKTRTGGPHKGYDINVRHELRTPVESLAAMIGTAFTDVEKENNFAGGSKTVDVTSKIMSMLSEGSGEHSSYSIPGGALMVAPGIDSDAIRRKAARSISLSNQLSKNAPVDDFTQIEAIRKSRENLLLSGQDITGRGGKLLPSFFQEGGYAPDRDQENRLVSWAQASRAIRDDVGQRVGTEVYLPTPKIKHATIAWTGRQRAIPLGPDMEPIPATPIERGVPRSGYRQTTADIGGRIPAQSLVLGTMFSPQYPIPGAGMYFPENLDTEIASGGYKTLGRFGVTQNVRGLINDDLQLRLSQKEGNTLPSNLSYDVFNLRTRDMKDTDPGITLSERAGTHSFVLSQQRLRVPQYYNAEGMGVSYDKQALMKKQITQVSDAQIEMLRKRYSGVPIDVDPTISEVSLEMGGYSKVGGKMAIGATKSELTPYEGRPMVSTGGRNIGIGALTWESKQMLETFTTSLGAVSPTAQYGILGEYAKSLQASDQSSQAREVRGFIKDLRSERADAPGARMDIQALANRVIGTDTNAPAHELTRDIFQRVFLGGQTTSQFAEMSDMDISEFAQSDRNLSNLRRFGMGYVTPDMTTPINKMWDQGQVEQLASEYVRGSKGMDPTAARERFAQQFGFDLSNARNGMVAQSFRPQGFFMPAIAGPAVEFSGGGTLGSEEAQLLNAIAPQFAKRLGASLEDTTSPSSLAMSRNDPVRWAQAQMAHLSMAEMDREAGTYVDIPNALTVNTEMATKMFADPEMRGLLSKDATDLTSLRKFEEKLQSFYPDMEDVKRRPIQFESAQGRYLPSTRGIAAEATENTATMQGELFSGEDVTQKWNMFRNAFSQGLTSQINDDSVGILEGTQKMTAHMMKQFGLPEGEKRDVIKKMMGTQVGVSSGHYAYWQELQQHEVYASKEKYMEAIRRELSSQGMDTPDRPLTNEEVEQVYNMIAGKPSTVGTAPEDVRAKGLAGVVARWPIVGGEESMLGMRFVTKEHLERSGRSAPPDAGLGNLHWRIGVGPSSVMQGDFDLDYMLALMGLKGERGAEGQLQVGLAAYTQKGRLGKDMSRLVDRTRFMDYQAMQQSLFPSQQAQEQYNPLLQAFADRDPNRQRGILSQVAGGLIHEQFKKSGYSPYASLLKGTEEYRMAKQMMGTSYNFTRSLEASAGASGWSTKGIMEGRVGRAQLYQPHLDLATAQAAPLVRMWQSSHLSVNEKTGKLGLGWGADTEKGLQFVRNSATVNELTEQNVGTLMTMMAGSAIQPTEKGELPSPSLLAYAFSPEESRMNTQDEEASRAAFLKYQGALQDPDQYGNRGQYLDDYYRATGLSNALELPYAQEGDVAQRASAMQDVMSGWMRANYYGDEKSRRKVFQGNMIGAMFSKSFAKKQQDEDWIMPADFQKSRLGAQMIMKANVHQPLFNMMKGGLASGSRLMNLMNSLQETSNLNVWALGNIKEQFGLGQDKFVLPQSKLQRKFGIDPDRERKLAKDFADAKLANQFKGTFDEFVEQVQANEATMAQASAEMNPNSGPVYATDLMNNASMIDVPETPGRPAPAPTSTEPDSDPDNTTQTTPSGQSQASTPSGGTPTRPAPSGGTPTGGTPTTPGGTPPTPTPPGGTPLGNTSRMPGLPADTNATRRAQKFLRAYKTYTPEINRQSGLLQAAVRDVTGSMPGPMGVMEALTGAGVTEGQREAILQQFSSTGQQAEELLSMGRRVSADIGKNVIDPNAVDMMALQEATEKTLLTNTPLGQNIVDLSAVGTTKAKDQKAFLRQAMAMGLSQDMVGGGLISRIRGSLGADVLGQSGLPIEDLRDIISGGSLDASSVNFEQLKELLAPGTAGAQQVAEAYSITGGAGIGSRAGAAAQSIFSRTPHVLQLGQLAEQLSAMPGFEHLKSPEKAAGAGATGEADVMRAVKGLHFEELGKITQSLVKNFEDLEKGQIKHKDAIETETRLLEKRQELQGSQALAEKASPLVSAGILSPEGSIGPGGEQRIRYRRTGAPVPEELRGASQAFDDQLIRNEGMPESGGTDRLIGGVRPSFMRRVLGGFGLMYMRSLGNIITGGMGFGQQERIGMEDTFGMAAGAMTGAGYTPQNQMQVLQNRMALGGQAYNPLMGFEMAKAQSPFLQDVSTAGGAGLGTYALLQQAALWGGEGSAFAQIANGGMPILGGRATLNSKTIVGGAVAASLAAQGYAKSKDPEGLAYRWGTGNMFSQMTGVTDIAGILMSGDIGGINQRQASYKMLQQNLESERGYTMQGMTDWLNQSGKGGTTYMDASDAAGQAWYGQATQKLLMDQNPQFGPETIAQVYQFMQRNQMNTKNFGDIAAQFQTGYTEEIAAATLGVFGMPAGQQAQQVETWAGGNAPTTLGNFYMQTAGMINQGNMPVYQAGLQYASQLGAAPEIRAQQYGLGPKQMTEQVLAWGELGGMTGDLQRQRELNYATMSTLGWNVEAPTAPSGPITAAQYGQQSYEEQRQAQRVQQIQVMADQFSSNFGLSSEQRQDFLGNMQGFYESSRLNSFTADVMSGASQMNPYALTQMYTMQQPGGALAGIGPQVQPWQVSKDIWGPGSQYAGQAVNLPAFTVSGATHSQFGQLSQQLGPEFMAQLGETGAGQAFLGGYQMEGTNMPEVAGMMGYQMYQADQQHKLQQAQSALSNRGNELQMEYLPRIWGLQDQMRDLGYQQQMWQFGQQEEQLAMQSSHFYQNMGMQQYQSQLQRGWQRQDWAFSDETRSMQHGWRVEDFEEQRRFMTGRDRRVAERQMERENIMYGREGEQIDRQRQRQEELWGLEDERFEVQKAQYEETHQFQEEAIKKNREYYEENFELQKKLTDLQRELTMKQLELQRESIALQQQMVEENHKMQQLQMAINLQMLENQTRMEQTQASFGDISEGMSDLFEEWGRFLAEGGSTTGISTAAITGAGISDYTPPQIVASNLANQASGGTSTTSGGHEQGVGGMGGYASGGEFWVGEYGPEKLTIGQQGPVSAMRGKIEPTNADPWKTSTFQKESAFGGTTKRETTIVVQIGNEEIKRYVVNAVEDEI